MITAEVFMIIMGMSQKIQMPTRATKENQILLSVKVIHSKLVSKMHIEFWL